MGDLSSKHLSISTTWIISLCLVVLLYVVGGVVFAVLCVASVSGSVAVCGMLGCCLEVWNGFIVLVGGVVVVLLCCLVGRVCRWCSEVSC